MGSIKMIQTERTRLKGWEKRLMRRTREELTTPFSWEQHNCGDFMAVAVEACYGPEHPLMQELIHGQDEQGVIERLAIAGGLEGILSKYLSPIHPVLGQDGDLALFGEGTVKAGCILLDGFAVGKGHDGKVHRLPINLCKVFML